MTESLVQLDERTKEQQQDDLVHVACCHDKDLALCGTDISDDPWVSESTQTTCAMCAAICESEDEYDDECVCPCCVGFPSERLR